MQKIPSSQIKLQCVTGLKKVRRTGQPLFVTRIGKLIAMVDPPPSASRKKWFGAMKGTGAICGDLTQSMTSVLLPS